MWSVQKRCGRILVPGLVLCAAGALAQPGPQPLRTAPAEKVTVNLGFRDWGPATVAGTTILAGNQTGRGGLFAVDTTTGKLRWSHRPVFASGTASVSTPPAVSGDVVITPYAAAYPGALIAVALASGRELWRGPDPAQDAAAAVSDGLAYILAKNGTFYALDAATGREKWKALFSATRAGCASRPIVRDGAIYLTAAADAVAGAAARPAGNYLFALDAKTGHELWHYRAEAPYVHPGVCLSQPVVSADAIFAAGDNHLYSVDRSTGRDRWKPIEVRRMSEGRNRPVEVNGLVDAGSVLIGVTPGILIAFDKNNGQTAWELPGQFKSTSPSTVVSGNTLYFQGSPGSTPAPAPSGTLHALDLATHAIIWSFTRATPERNWPFGTVTPVDGALWVDANQALLKLQ